MSHIVQAQTDTLGINGWFLQHPYTGIGQYTINLLKEFTKKDASKFLVVVPNEACVARMKQEGIDLPAEILPLLSWAPASIQKHWWEQVQLPGFFEKRALGGAGVQKVWLPYPCVTWLRKPTYTTIVTVHDTIPWTEKEYQRGMLSALAHAMSRGAVKRANTIITVSETSAESISKVCDVPRETIHVILNGVADVFFEHVDPQEILQKYGLTQNNYFLYVGGYDIRKQVKKLVASYEEYSKTQLPATPSSFPLVLVGGQAQEDHLYADFLTSQASGDTVKVVTTSFVSDDVLNALYEGCRAFLHFSRVEGFNVPAVQALVKNRPCVLSDIPVHREIAGEFATYVNPDDPQSTAAVWRTLTAQPPASADNFPRDHYRWSRSAEQHLKVF